MELSGVLTLFRAAALQPVCRRRRLKTFQIFQALHRTQVWQKPWAQADWVQIWVITTLKLQQEIPRGSMGFQSAFFDWARLRECVWDINPDICQFKVCKAKVWALLFHAVPLSVLLQFPMNSPNDLRRQKTPSRRAKRRRRFVRPDLGFYLQNCPKSQEGVEEGVASRYFTGTGD